MFQSISGSVVCIIDHFVFFCRRKWKNTRLEANLENIENHNSWLQALVTSKHASWNPVIQHRVRLGLQKLLVNPMFNRNSQKATQHLEHQPAVFDLTISHINLHRDTQ